MEFGHNTIYNLDRKDPWCKKMEDLPAEEDAARVPPREREREIERKRERERKALYQMDLWMGMRVE
jgi:hypothetical protein